MGWCSWQQAELEPRFGGEADGHIPVSTLGTLAFFPFFFNVGFS